MSLDTLEIGETENNQKEPAQKTPKKKHSFLKIFGILFIAGMVLAAVVGYGLYRWATNDLPSFSRPKGLFGHRPFASEAFKR